MSVNVIHLLEKIRDSWTHLQSDPMEIGKQAVEDCIKQVIAAADSDYLGELYRTDYEVEGSDEFPVDMLRYACSWPADEESARLIERSLQDSRLIDDTPVRRVRLSKYHRDAVPVIAEDRWWAKFRWRVVGDVNTVSL